jgi:ABC-type microcin C transport system permease subunit YejB
LSRRPADQAPESATGAGVARTEVAGRGLVCQFGPVRALDDLSFGLPDLGQLAWQSVTTQDLPVIVGTVLVASTFIVANLLVDLGYALLDPRVRPS